MTSSSDDPKHDPRHDPAVSAGAPNFRTGGGDAEAPGAGAGAVGAGAVGAGAAEAGPVEPPVIDATASGTVPPEAADDATGTAAGRDAELEAQLAEMREKWVRTEAELQNVRNRARREVEDARQYAVQKFARDVVEAAENLRRGLGSLPAGDGADGMVAKLREGFESVERSFLGILERNGIKATDPTGA
ncbi:MAG: nucleotide exchange factor GrpE, partial [Gluconacetobacter diazotrophicus]|nr:nucleotide exchange factor GrpE [Gluconacetobacter diazotrophicus]